MPPSLLLGDKKQERLRSTAHRKVPPAGGLVIVPKVSVCLRLVALGFSWPPIDGRNAGFG